MPRKKAVKKEPKNKRPKGRPIKFTEEIGAEICARLAAGESLRAICRDNEDKFPAQATVHLWIFRAQEKDCPEDLKLFAEQYAQARKIQAEGFIDEVLEISDDGTNDWMIRKGKPVINKEALGRSRLRVDTRKWVASKVLPKIYGDKLIHDLEKLQLPELSVRVVPSKTTDSDDE